MTNPTINKLKTQHCVYSVVKCVKLNYFLTTNCHFLCIMRRKCGCSMVTVFTLVSFVIFNLIDPIRNYIVRLEINIIFHENRVMS